MYEATLCDVSGGRYKQHLYVVTISEGKNVSWSPLTSDTICMRSPVPLSVGEWTPIEVPSAGTLIKFQVDVAIRVWRGPHYKRYRDIEQGYFHNLHWIERKLPEWGLAMADFVDVDPFQVFVAKTPKEDEPKARPYYQRATRFCGFATVVDPEKFGEKLIGGVGGHARPYGFCFLLFHVV